MNFRENHTASLITQSHNWIPAHIAEPHRRRGRFCEKVAHKASLLRLVPVRRKSMYKHPTLRLKADLSRSTTKFTVKFTEITAYVPLVTKKCSFAKERLLLARDSSIKTASAAKSAGDLYSAITCLLKTLCTTQAVLFASFVQN
eukprot:26981_1